MAELVICRGLQGSGKTTWARDWVAEDPARRVRVNRDDLRDMVDNGVYIKGITEARIIRLRDAAILAALESDLDVVSDDMNLAARVVKDLARLAVRANRKDRLVTFRAQDFTDVPLEECIRRDANRDVRDYIGKSVITDNYNRFLKGKTLPLPFPALDDLWGEGKDSGVVQPYVARPGTPKAILVDVDGTVALMGDRNPFDEANVIDDAPNWPVINVVKLFFKAGYEIIVMSGRTDGCEQATATWLDLWLGGWTELHMRKSGDTRADNIVKQELFARVRDRYDIKIVLDDRDKVVDMWRSMGLTVLQVAPGDF